MIVDAHNHIWDVPWGHLAPDVDAGNASRFLHQMDQNGVQYALVVCHLDEYDSQNNERALARAAEYPDRFRIFVNVHLHGADALAQVRNYVGRPGLVGVSYYMNFQPDDDGAWMRPGPLLDCLAEHRLAVNLNLAPAAHPRLRALAQAYPETPFFICHLGGPRRREGERLLDVAEWESELRRSGEVQNLHVKISGFAYYSAQTWEYPYRDVLPFIAKLAAAFTPRRLLWGSDYPPTMRYLTYRQALEVVRTHCEFLTETEKSLVLGGNAQRLFDLPD